MSSLQNRFAQLVNAAALVCVSATATGQELSGARESSEVSGWTLTRGGAVSLALKRNPQVLAANARVAEARARRGQAEAAGHLSTTLTLGVGPSLKAELVPGTAVQSTKNAYGDVELSDLSVVMGGQVEFLQPLYTFGKISKRQAAADHEIRARLAQGRISRADIALQVAELYETMLFARDSVRFLEETEHWLQRTTEETVEEIEAGTGLTEQDLLRLEAAAAVLKLALNQARAGVRQARAGLVATLGWPLGSVLQPKEQRLELLPWSVESERALIALALKNRPELVALTEGQAAFDSLAEAVEADNYPDFFALAFLSGAYTPGRDLVDSRFAVDPLNHFVPGALVGVRWSFQAGMADQRAAETRAKALGFKHTADWARAGVPAQVVKAFEDLKRAQNDVEVAENAVQRVKKWLVMASADFAIGVGDSRNVTDASEAYVGLRVASFHAKFRHNVALAKLAQATGTLNDQDSRFYPTTETR